MQRKNFPELQAWLPGVKAPIEARLSRYVRSLAAEHTNEILQAWASCVIVTGRDRRLLLTAKHAIDRLDGRGLFVEALDRFEPIPLSTNIIAEHSGADVTVVELPEVAREWGLDALVLESQSGPQLSNDELELFCAMGFPVRESALDFEAAQLNMKTVSYWSFEHHDAYRLLKVSPAQHVATKFDRQHAYQYGMVRTMKKPEGMSGGALWRFWGPSDELPSLSRVALAGIITDWKQSPARCILSTRVGLINRIIAEALE
jgi:hypothetical protein